MLVISLAYFQFRENERTSRVLYFSFLVIACVTFLALFNLVSILVKTFKTIWRERVTKRNDKRDLDELNEVYEQAREERKMKEDKDMLFMRNRFVESLRSEQSITISTDNFMRDRFY